MKIVISGDSWGCGEWIRLDLRQGGEKDIIHGGLAQYLAEDGHTVTNLSQGFGSNTAIHSSISQHLESESIKGREKTDKIIVFQTTYTRDYRFRHNEDWTKITEANTLAHIWLSRFYHRLSEISKLYNVPVYVIGALSDTVWLDNMSEHYPGVSIPCQSLVNLIVNGNHRVDQPVFSWYTKTDLPFIDELKNTLPKDKLEDFFNQIDQGIARQNVLNMHPEYFFPDGVHPNRHGHEILYKFLKELQIV